MAGMSKKTLSAMIVVAAALLGRVALAAEPPAEPPPADDAALADRLAERLKEPIAQPVKAPTASASAVRGEAARRPRDAASKPATAKPALPDPAHWAYAGPGGPEHWAELAPAFKACGVGTRQSPVDIHDTVKVDQDALKFDYKPGGFAVLDDGHTVLAIIAPGSFLTVLGRRYQLVEIRFHKPSEQRIEGRRYDMEAQLVHKDAEGHLAIVAVMLQRRLDDAGAPVLATVLGNLPLERGTALAAADPLDPATLLPAQPGYFALMGSLTTPPCSEDVLWLVMRQAMPVSGAELDVFGHLYPMNARPLQAGSGRLIKESR